MTNDVATKNPLVRELADQLGILLASRISRYMQQHMSGDEHKFLNGFVMVPCSMEIENDEIRGLLNDKEHFEGELSKGFTYVEFRHVSISSTGEFSYYLSIPLDFLGAGFEGAVLDLKLTGGSVDVKFFDFPVSDAVIAQKLRDGIKHLQGAIVMES